MCFLHRGTPSDRQIYLVCDMYRGITVASKGLVTWTAVPFVLFLSGLCKDNPPPEPEQSDVPRRGPPCFQPEGEGSGYFCSKWKTKEMKFVKPQILLMFLLIHRWLQRLDHRHRSPTLWYKRHPCRCCDLSAASVQVGVTGNQTFISQLVVAGNASQRINIRSGYNLKKLIPQNDHVIRVSHVSSLAGSPWSRLWTWRQRDCGRSCWTSFSLK